MLLSVYNNVVSSNAVFARLTYPKKDSIAKKLDRRHIPICDLVSSIYTRFVRGAVHVCRIGRRSLITKNKERRFKSRLKAKMNLTFLILCVFVI